MLDAVPQREETFLENEIMREAALRRLHAYRRQARLVTERARQAAQTQRRAAPPGAVSDEVRLELVARWAGDIDLFRDRIEMSTDWSPFELCDVAPLGRRSENKRRVLCVFLYHGSENERAHYEKILREALARITQWEETPL